MCVFFLFSIVVSRSGAIFNGGGSFNGGSFNGGSFNGNGASFNGSGASFNAAAVSGFNSGGSFNNNSFNGSNMMLASGGGGGGGDQWQSTRRATESVQAFDASAVGADCKYLAICGWEHVVSFLFGWRELFVTCRTLLISEFFNIIYILSIIILYDRRRRLKRLACRKARQLKSSTMLIM